MKTHRTDVVVVGAGAAGLLAALTARTLGLDVVLVESTSIVGGSTASDTGQMWLPNNPWVGKSDPADSPEDALRYLNALLGEETPSSTRERRETFVKSSSALGRWLDKNGIALTTVRGRTDCHPAVNGSRRTGRILASPSWDRRTLGTWAERLRGTDYRLQPGARSLRGLIASVRGMAHQLLRPTRDVVIGGTALAGQLLARCLAEGVTIWVDTPMLDLVITDDKVTGVQVRREGQAVEVLAARGVLLACGGFEGNQKLREEYLPLPTNASWSTGLASNLGDGMRVAVNAGAATADLHEAWWTLVAQFDKVTYRMTSERSLPHGVIVDSAGARFINEAGPTPEIGRHVYNHHRSVRSIPSWLIIDRRHRDSYRLGPYLPGTIPNDTDATRAMSINELANQLGIDQAGLLGTIVRFNNFAHKSKDADFRRGASVADRTNGDATLRRNPNLGKVSKAPFWGIPLYPGDSGTKGGVLVNANAQVLREDGSVIEGLWAVAGVSASLFKGTSPGSGSGLASALVDAWRGIHAMAEALEELDAEAAHEADAE